MQQFEKSGEKCKIMKEKEIKPINISSWKRAERPRTKSSRVDIYYYPPSGKARLRSLNDVKKYCDKENLKFEPVMFSFKPLNLDQHYDSRDENSNDSFSESLSNDEANIFQEEIYNFELPKSFEDTRKSPERKLWEEAMKSELKVKHDRNVWTLVDPPDKSKILDCIWVYTVKTNQTDGSKTFKARLVARGFNQIAGVDYSDVFSPVVNFSVVRFMFFLFVSILCWNHVQLDIRAAYLYGNLSETIYMHQPPGFVNKGEENKVYYISLYVD
ncbi:Copia protein [Araneus ventricosus]|uniref:Copia protein n=1 Tax=Araneus ventricosus TaxID=182803 RepID=A0A4Y2DU74_ARAVE|nr:Copia protein [Araneus ventricosus]